MKLNVYDRTLRAAIYVLLVLLSFLTFYPFWNSLVISFNTGSDTSLGGVTFWPREFTLENYRIVFQEDAIFQAYLITILRTAAGTVLSMFFTALFAYGLSKRGIVFKKFYMILCVITMYFSGGLIPYFVLVYQMKLYDTFAFLVIHGMISVYNMIIFRTFFAELPDGLEESARIDGCSNYGVFFRIVLPVSGPVVATLSLFTAVGLWNDWFTPAVFINDPNLIPLQTMLVQIINAGTTATLVSNLNSYAQSMVQNTVTVKALQMATMMVATLPILLVYPFLQKYFVKGALVGSLKE
ncbi:carbohydrate ABC transporter permease [Paenibacillus mucilaginosus]|uniref:Binding-protein-dependent transport systems inner membrane component n=3 Tax=Paenibacillus mucilaginosus TaxID=61624 RepID=H6NNH4_9BACL|nr:carbohydrate ABC transporter permease [Paenibacillus mucilaginosus]AEI44794.1 binding-protein-dependent transport systems inner membrane component [Paenibacillus mucilaginosus KNP414]AFC32553.1 binding-protein-dependent transport systems inner membrane component [Paenibacillus mucilaginosus 3016]AFH64874.1 ABC transporter permease [Paenibacillus mucilaginosus K02]MCG7214842.1 carbohydrate ABC transporter permease [Paenibacillus mucilaginosus]WDM26324.1 carbohydrate ABC transporter permease 